MGTENIKECIKEYPFAINIAIAAGQELETLTNQRDGLADYIKRTVLNNPLMPSEWKEDAYVLIKKIEGK